MPEIYLRANRPACISQDAVFVTSGGMEGGSGEVEALEGGEDVTGPAGGWTEEVRSILLGSDCASFARWDYLVNERFVPFHSLFWFRKLKKNVFASGWQRLRRQYVPRRGRNDCGEWSSRLCSRLHGTRK